MNITDLIHLTQQTRDKFANIEGNKILLHQVSENFVKHINICIANDRKHI